MKLLAIAVVAALCLVQAQAGTVRRDAPATNTVTFESLFELGQQAFRNFTQQLQAALPTHDEVKQNLQARSSELATKLQEASAAFSEKATQVSAELQQAVQQGASNLEQHATTLRRQFPDVAAGADSLKRGIESTLADLRSLEQTLRPHTDEASEALKAALRTAVEQATNVANTARQQIEQASQPHSH